VTLVTNSGSELALAGLQVNQFHCIPVKDGMYRSHFFIATFLASVLPATDLMAQVDELVAYVPAKPIERTADSESIGFMSGAVGGKAEAILPTDAYKADILNVRGNIERTYSSEELGTLSLADISSGTWTLRVHTPRGFLVRRFVVMARGGVIWSPENDPKAKNRRRSRSR